MFCGKCGFEIKNDIKFCPKCGNPVTQARANEIRISSVEKNKRSKSFGKFPKVFISAIVVLAIAAGIIFGLGGNGKNGASKAEKELLEIIDSAELLWTQAVAAENELYERKDNNEISSAQCGYEDSINFANLYQDLLVLEEKAETIDGIDGKLADAVEAYFEMMTARSKGVSNSDAFISDYISLYENYFSEIPESSDNDVQGSAYALYDWQEDLMAAYYEINCPDFVKTDWQRYGAMLESYKNVAVKMYEAYEYGDWLRFYSAKEIKERNLIKGDLEYDIMLERVNDYISFAVQQMNCSSALAEEMHNYTGLNNNKREEYIFENTKTGKISINYETLDTIYPALYNTYDAWAIIKVGSYNGVRDIVVEAEIPGLTQVFKKSYRITSDYQAICICPPLITGTLDLSSAKNGQIAISIYEKDGTTLIQTKSFPITIKSINDFETYSNEYGLATRDNLLSCLRPESEAVSMLKREAVNQMERFTNGIVNAFVGYQSIYSENNVTTFVQAAGLMQAMYALGVRYNADSYSASGSNQHILLPDQVIERKSGLCIETTLLIASALQSAGMHAFIITPPGHAQVAVETWNGSGCYFLIETTALNETALSDDVIIEYGNALFDGKRVLDSSCPVTYMTSDEWYEYINVEGTYIIDCNDGDILGISAMSN